MEGRRGCLWILALALGMVLMGVLTKMMVPNCAPPVKVGEKAVTACE